MDGLIKAKEIRLPAPFLQGFPRGARDPALADRSIDFTHQLIFVGQIMYAANELFVPILFRFADRAPDRVNVNFNALALELRHLAINESLAERRKSLEKVGDLAHSEDSTAQAAVATLCGA